MLRQAKNDVKIEGILSEVDVKQDSYTKNGQNVDCIRGSIKVRTSQPINGIETTLEIPVHFFSNKYTKKGTPNPAYESISKLMTDYVSIAAAGNEDEADRVRITGASIRMNEFYSGEDKLVSYPRINASFISRVKKDEFKPIATFDTEFVVANKIMEVDRDGIETGRLKVKGIIPQFGGTVDVVEFIVANEKAVADISTYWTDGDTVKANGRINFSSRTETVLEEVDFGEPIERTRTINTSELMITGGSRNPEEGEFAFDRGEIDEALQVRKAKLENQKARDLSKTKQKAAPANGSSFDNLGF